MALSNSEVEYSLSGLTLLMALPVLVVVRQLVNPPSEQERLPENQRQIEGEQSWGQYIQQRVTNGLHQLGL
jgi:hypothetical protein